MLARMPDERHTEVTRRPIVIRSGRDPVDLITDDHWRQRAMLADLADYAQVEEPDPERAAALLLWLNAEVSVHALDEDDDLLPLLRRRAEPDDDIEAIIGRLQLEHARARARAELVRQALEGVASDGAALDEPDRALIRDHVAQELRHLIFENAVILPLARARLSPSDRRSLALRMAARRGYCLWPRKTNETLKEMPKDA